MSTEHPTASALKQEIRAAFGAVAFPSRGLRGSSAMDDYATMEEVEAITLAQDVHGEWWEIPPGELHSHVLGLSYLDRAGVLFYLPAYLNMAIDDVGKTRLSVLDLIDTGLGGDDPLHRAYLEARLGGLSDEHRRVCLRVLRFLRLRLAGDIAREDERARVERVLGDPYWRRSDMPI
jgi:hypothetical protein